ncbi:MAG: diadenylate cyclase CdaA [Oscillospiraceae bacterium]|jgi:diadenylate cyclase|nr:diadenylate cyclase CdaA [Oscillospiraceae bacterium]
MSEPKQNVTLFFEHVWALLSDFGFTDFLDILLLTLIIFGLMRLLRETRSVQLLKGVFWLVVAYTVINALKMSATKFLFDQLFSNFVVLLLVLFQPEVRSIFESMGRSNVSSLRFLSGRRRRDAARDAVVADAINEFCDAVQQLSAERIGALTVFEQDVLLGEIVKTGTVVDAKVSRQLIGNIFYPKAPLHDGAAIIREGTIAAAGCILPLTENPDLPSNLGTRHRAAIGMSEQCDALICVVSEETGSVSLAFKGSLRRDLSKAELETILRRNLLRSEEVPAPAFARIFHKNHDSDNLDA